MKGIRWLLAATFFFAPVVTPAQTRAGEVRAIIPTGYVVRSGAVQREVKKFDPVYWQDILRTDRGGRMRIGLHDGSLLNIGSESQLQVLEHDAAVQRTRLQLAYGRMRASVVRIARPDGSFEVRTPTAVAGVVGTRFSVIIRQVVETIVVALEVAVRVRNADPSVGGEVVLQPGQFTRVLRGAAPTPPEAAPPDLLREAEEDLDFVPPEPEISRVEISWPPAGCGAGTTLLVRAWKTVTGSDGKEMESPVGEDAVGGSLRLGPRIVRVEGGRASLADPPTTSVPQGEFTPAGRATPVQTKIWEPVELGEGEGWRVPRAVFAGNAFAMRGPIGGRRPSVQIGGQVTQILWQGPCGAGLLAPMLPGNEYPLTVELDGEQAASGTINLISVSYRMPTPPTIMRGQQSKFGVDILGLAGLSAFTQGRPVMIVTLTNTTPAIIGNLRTSTPGGTSSGETLTYRVGGQSVGAGGVARLDGIATGRSQGMFNLDVNLQLDPALGQPRFALVAVTRP